MILQEKVNSLPHVCGIELDFAGEFIPSSYPEDFLQFYNSYESNNDFNQAYFGQRTVRLKESSSNSRSGIIYNQSLSIQFPSNDLNRALRIELFRKTKFVKIKLSNNTYMVFGRNDHFQNKKPDVKFESDIKITKVTFTAKSISPLGYTKFDTSVFGFPIDIPIDFINIL